ncbi:MAG TPA: hypothetical protein VKE26_18350 [Xanthobacteraceae bacterium]|nr:hypothetical protein [Xanthobacteraceae bacterium]
MDEWIWTSYGFGFGQVLFFLIMLALVLYPAGRILRRLGLSPLWSLLTLFPLINVIFLWVLAFARWPLEDRAGAAQAK